MRGRRVALGARKTFKKGTNNVRRLLLGVAQKIARGENLSVAIVSCDRWRGKVYDDMLLQGEFLRQGVDAEIISWQDKAVRYEKYNAIVIGSMWGYQNYLDEFTKWLEKMQGRIVVNPIEVIENNYDKARQFEILERAGLPTVKTTMIRVGELGKFKVPSGEFVIKPVISGGGENTFLVRDEAEFERLQSKLRHLNEKRGLLVQPFLPEICDGELGLILINGNLVSAVRRFPGVISGEFHVGLVALKEIPDEARKIALKVARLPEYREAAYLRVDFAIDDAKVQIMEAEAFEPQLYYYLLKGEARKKILHAMVAEVEKRIIEEDNGVHSEV